MNRCVYGTVKEANQTMDSSKQKSFFLRSTTAVSLNERFSQVIKTQAVTFDPVVLQQEAGDDAVQVVLLLKREPPTPVHLKTRVPTLRSDHQARRRSVWTRLSWQPLARRCSTRRRRGFWSFRKKYRWGARFGSAHRSGGNLRHRLGQRRLLKKRNFQKPTEGGGASSFRGRNWKRGVVPTKEELDAELDKYMSMSKRRLDEQLDEYMAMAGQADLRWDWGVRGQTDLTWD
ncbi:chromatin target of PRMT1 protein-like isoform X2 [Cheilinus undulatus]|uniref:chromatin target of PRMT1 protein-like isoform X2 n=1 Tax=Cheilinus undulatus TaxID=241271 RepID=UPI001BD348A9|nr:chromatin target of PRMT1 protein-like isoform X2 [Cheilinus undulatus]